MYATQGHGNKQLTFQLEKLAKEGVVYLYARNDRLEFNIPYELYRNPHPYEPDFIVRLRNSVSVVLEIKGKSHEDTDAKQLRAKRWVSAVNAWGRLVRAGFPSVPRAATASGSAVLKLIAARKERVRQLAAELQAKAEAEADRVTVVGLDTS